MNSSILRATSVAVRSTSDYQWGHMEACNCGHLAQQISHLTKELIHQKAMQSHGDWSEQLNDYCSASGLPLDDLITDMLNAGFDTTDLKHLERLTDPDILNTLPFENRLLIYNNKADVATYLEAWANKMETELIGNISLHEISDRQLTENYL